MDVYYSNTTIVSINPKAKVVLTETEYNSNTTIVSINHGLISGNMNFWGFKYNYCFY